MMTKEAKQSLILSQVHALVGEWLPFGANQISALNERLGAMERCQGGLFSSKLDMQPTETHFEVTPGLTQVKILDFDAIRFINFEAEINFPESDGVIQVENFGMHLHVSGAVLYGVKIDAIMNHTERSIPLDLLARLLVDVHQDSSGIIHDLLSRYQLSVLDMLFMGKAEQRNKYNLITAAVIEPKLPARMYLDKGERENELKQVLGEIYACYDITRDDVLFLGRDGCLLSGPGAERYEALLTTFMGLNSREIFIRNFFVRTFVLNDMLMNLRQSIRNYRKHGEHALKGVKKSLSDAARHMILLIECLQYLLESVEALELPPVPVDIAGSKIYKSLQLLERKNNVIVRCKDSIKLIERLRTQLDTLITKFEGISRLQLTYVSQGFDINIQRLTESLRVRDQLGENLDVIRMIFAGNLSFDIIDRLSGGTFNVPNPSWFLDWIKKPIIDVPLAFLVINLLWLAVVWIAIQAWLDRQVFRAGATLVIRAHTDKRINLMQLRRFLSQRDLQLGTFEYELGGRPELQSYIWVEDCFPSKGSTTHVMIVVDEKQKLLRSIRLQIACPLEESVPIHSRRLSRGMHRMRSYSTLRRPSRRLHPAPSSVTTMENNILEQFSILLRGEGVYQERHAPLARLGSQLNLLALTHSYNQETNTDNPMEVERRFWKGLRGTMDAPVYGADIVASLFGNVDALSWNLGDLNTILRKIDLPGVTRPMLYFGMWRAMFAFHTEDMDLFSINYVHTGKPKFWYGIPPDAAPQLERAAQSMFPEKHHTCSQFLRHKTSLISPARLREFGVPFYRAYQKPGEFVITFPAAYHQGFNLGLNIAEAVNFASLHWIPYGLKAKVCKCLPDSVRIDMDSFLTKLFSEPPSGPELLGDDPWVFSCKCHKYCSSNSSDVEVEAKVTAVEGKYIRVHYKGESADNDEWLPVSSKELQRRIVAVEPPLVKTKDL
ncbi:hypothetical protein BBO99_00001827 [Phytophthora kernoviae]|uniref:JmjC domain-containing protein n=3 Tax=Phytophthora kernoviae TaxID=325452 RepID=A0A3R7KN00_9STRA|nr:hypothetical protein JM18_001606 [Phytophthora kernoviae]RLN83746.1 hypothetical protein BBO99_00001827 [Phytophthora kernoviae]